MNRKRVLLNAVWLVLALALIVRIWAAWAYRADLHHDRGRAALMAMHMAEGVDYTAFAYGAPHLGSLEPALAALVIRLFGYHEFGLNLTTALLAFLALPVIYAWTRETGGRTAALAALLYLAFGPWLFLAFSILPRGGYALMLLLFTALLWVAGNLVRREVSAQRHASLWLYRLLGGLLGLSWWTHQLLFAASLTVVIWLLASVHFRILNRRFLSLILLFFLFSAPWWIWNLLHHWESLAFLPSPWPSALQRVEWLSLGGRMIRWTLLPAEWGWVAWLGPVIFGAAVLGAFLLFVHALHTRKTFPGWIHLGIALSFLPVFVFCYATSSFAAMDPYRPFMLIAPVFALMLGCCTAWMFHRLRRRWAACIPLAVLLAGNLQAFVQSHRPTDNPERRAAAVELAGFCRQQGIDVVFVHRWLHWMNVVSGEQVVFCDVEAEPYAPYEKAGNQARQVALLDNVFGLDRFLRATDCNWTSTRFGPYNLMWNFTPAPEPAPPLPVEALASVFVEEQTNNLAYTLTDMDCDTAWFTRVSATGAARRLIFTLKEPVALCGIRLWCNRDRYPGLCRVEGRTSDEGAWRELLPPIASTPFYWSGPRWYINGLFYRMMYRWPASEPLTAVRVSFLPPAEYSYEVDLAELQLLAAPAPNDDARADDEGLEALVRSLEERNVVRCFADRFLSARLDRATGGRIETVQPSFMERSVHSGECGIVNEYRNVDRLTPHDAMLVPLVEAPALERVLERHRINMRRTTIGSLALFDDAPGAYTRESAFYPGLKWIGYGCLSNHRFNRKFKGHYYYREAMDSDDDDLRLDYLREAVTLYPRHKAAWRALADLSHLRGNLPLYQTTLKALDGFAPGLATDMAFPNGVVLLGVTPVRVEGCPGEELEMWYHWECPPAERPTDYAVFVHFESGDHRFQDDHVLLEDVEEQDITGQLTPETFITRRVFRVPETMPPGDYEIGVGLYNRRTSFRLRPEGSLKTVHKAVVLPFTVRLASEPDAEPSSQMNDQQQDALSRTPSPKKKETAHAP